MASLLWKTRCPACDRVYSRHRSRCPDCRRQNPRSLAKLIKVILILFALAATVAIWVAIWKRARL